MTFWTSIPALIIIGAVLIPLAVYASLGVGEKILAGLRPLAAGRIRPWLWLTPPLLIVLLVLVYPLFVTIYYAFRNARGTEWSGLRNLVWSFSGDMLSVISNSLLWLVVLPLGTVLLSVAAAVLFDRVKYERVAITIVLLPTAISFTAASIIWRQLFSYQPPDSVQLGLLNALWTAIPGTRIERLGGPGFPFTTTDSWDSASPARTDRSL